MECVTPPDLGDSDNAKMCKCKQRIASLSRMQGNLPSQVIQTVQFRYFILLDCRLYTFRRPRPVSGGPPFRFHRVAVTHVLCYDGDQQLLVVQPAASAAVQAFVVWVAALDELVYVRVANPVRLQWRRSQPIDDLLPFWRCARWRGVR